MTDEERAQMEEMLAEALSPIRLSIALIRAHLDRFGEQLSRLS